MRVIERRIRRLERIQASVGAVYAGKSIEMEVDDQLALAQDAVDSIRALVKMMSAKGTVKHRFMKMLSQAEQTLRDIEAFASKVARV